MAEASICRNCFHSYVCEQFNENKDDNNKKCHFFNDHYVPQTDVVEVVRCKDCKYLFDYSPDEKPFCELFADGYDHQFRPNPEDYCSRAEPRTPKERGGEK